MALREDVLRRLLVSKRFLESGGLLTRDSDPAAVGGAILAAHDAAELALNAIATQLDVKVPDRAFMSDLMDAIDKSGKVPEVLGARARMNRLNTARRGLKHDGVFPDPKDFYRVVEHTRDAVDGWCTTHLGGLTLDDIDLAVLIEDHQVRGLHAHAKHLFETGRYREALEDIGLAVSLVMRRSSSRTLFGGLYGITTEDALAAAAYGVRPSDFLNLGRFLPTVHIQDGEIEIRWDERERGHEGNWHSEAVAYCLEVFVDVAIKLQHVRPPPMAWEFFLIFDDVIKAKVDGVEVWRDKVAIPYGPVVGREVICTLRQGEELRGLLHIKKGFEAVQPHGSEQVHELGFHDDSGFHFGKVLKDEVEVLRRPKDSSGVRSVAPHLFEEDET